jgi:uncharacterized protein YpbB
MEVGQGANWDCSAKGKKLRWERLRKLESNFDVSENYFQVRIKEVDRI